MENIVFKPELLGKQIGVGATADVFAYGENKVIKIFHSTMDAAYVEREYHTSAIIEKTGLPVPHNDGICKVFGTSGSIDGCTGIIQERIHGISIMRKIMDYRLPEDFSKLQSEVEQVVNLQIRINQIDAAGLGIPEQKEVLRYFISVAPLLTETEKEKLYSILESLPSGSKLCHCDYHFDNIFSTDRGLVCFDWCDAVCGNPTADLARSLLIFFCEETPDSIPVEVKKQIAQLRDFSVDFYRETYQKNGGSFDHLEAWMAIVAAGRLNWEVSGNKPAMLRIVRKYLQ